MFRLFLRPEYGPRGARDSKPLSGWEVSALSALVPSVTPPFLRPAPTEPLLGPLCAGLCSLLTRRFRAFLRATVSNLAALPTSESTAPVSNQPLTLRGTNSVLNTCLQQNELPELKKYVYLFRKQLSLLTISKIMIEVKVQLFWNGGHCNNF